MRFASDSLVWMGVGLLLVVSAPAHGRTWRVALDGSGDTVSIHEAGQLAASGDTISIAPGRYSTLIDHFDGYDTRKVIAAIEGEKELTLVGDDRDLVIIGPLAFQFQSPDSPVGLFWRSSMPLTIQNVSIVNSYTGLRSDYSALIVDSCRFSGNQIGTTSRGGDTYIGNSYYEGRSDGDAAMSEVSLWTPGVDTCVVWNCDFVQSGVIRFSDIDWGELRDSRVEGFYTRFYLASGVIERCDLSSFVSVDGTGAFGVQITDSVFRAGPDVEFGLNVYNTDSHLEISGNTFEGGTAKNINLHDGASINGSGNHIFHQPGSYAVQLENYPEDSTAVVDLSGNYWGTTEPDSVAAWIWDANDAECNGWPDPVDVCTEVLYLPIEPEPVPAEKTSLGGLKALFR